MRRALASFPSEPVCSRVTAGAFRRAVLAAGLLLWLGAAAPAALAQPPEVANAAELALALKKLRVTGTALYVAAHPDDENTAFLAWLSRDRLVRTAYLSMTRGDGGQNLLGSEKGELMGLIRTQELLAARRIDGAEQFFTRAIDFGYSKSPQETLSIWGREQVLADTVWVIRKLRPDVIVTRFPTTGEGGHGHHTASALLAEEAFVAAADPNRFPEQLRYVTPWQAKRLLWNVFRFSPNAPRKDEPGQVSVDLGAYNPLLGRSYTEIAAQSRSMHKSQGFGSAERRGSFVNDFRPRLGEKATADLFEGVDLTWDRVSGGAAVDKFLAEAERAFDPTNPGKVIPILAHAYAAMSRLRDEPIVEAKKRDLLDAIRSAAGFWAEAIATEHSGTPGGDVKVDVMALSRTTQPLTLEKVEIPYVTSAPVPTADLKFNQPARAEVTLRLPESLPYTNPYWLEKPAGKGLYEVADPMLVGLPEARPPLVARFTVRAAGESLPIEVPVLYRWTDPVKGEQYRPFEIAPPVTIDFDERIHLFADSTPHPMRLTVKAGESGLSGHLRLRLPAGWKVEPAESPFTFAKKGDELSLTIRVTPPKKASVVSLVAEAEVGGRTTGRSVQRINYAHIPIQTLFPKAEAKLVRVDVRRDGSRVGYVMGSGDEIPQLLKQLGYDVTLLTDEDLDAADLSTYDAIVTGVRAFNTRGRLRPAHERLMKYVEGGGALVVQYNTSFELTTDEIGPYPFKISRDRVTVEEAPVRLAREGHTLLTFPNAIGPADFDGWVQERGLYFAGTWDPRYEAVLGMNDPGETEKLGSLLYARYGKGAFVYTGLAFFRQLPAGVPGAARLFANLLAAGRHAGPAAKTGAR